MDPVTEQQNWTNTPLGQRELITLSMSEDKERTADPPPELASVIDSNASENDLLASLCDDRISEAEQIEHEFAASKRSTKDQEQDLIEGHIVGIYSGEVTVQRQPADTDRAQWQEIDRLTVPSGEILIQGPSEDASEVDQLSVVCWIQTDDFAVETFSKPVPWSKEEYKFARVVDSLGYNHSSVDMVEGEPILLEKTGDSWSIPDPNSGQVVIPQDLSPDDSTLRASVSNWGKSIAAKLRQAHFHQFIAVVLITAVGVAVVGWIVKFLISVAATFRQMMLDAAPAQHEGVLDTFLWVTLALYLLAALIRVVHAAHQLATIEDP